jgi:hypothetical protein
MFYLSKKYLEAVFFYIISIFFLWFFATWKRACIPLWLICWVCQSHIFTPLITSPSSLCFHAQMIFFFGPNALKSGGTTLALFVDVAMLSNPALPLLLFLANWYVSSCFHVKEGYILFSAFLSWFHVSLEYLQDNNVHFRIYCCSFLHYFYSDYFFHAPENRFCHFPY